VGRARRSKYPSGRWNSRSITRSPPIARFSRPTTVGPMPLSVVRGAKSGARWSCVMTRWAGARCVVLHPGGAGQMSHLQNHAGGVNSSANMQELGEMPASVFWYHGAAKQPDTGNKTRTRAMSLKDTLSAYWVRIQGELLPWLEDTMGGPLSGHH